MKERDLFAKCLLTHYDHGRYDVFSARDDVENMHPDLESTSILVSGHHAFVSIKGDRIIMDNTGGVPTESRPI